MKLATVSYDWNMLLLENVTDDDAKILEILGCEKVEADPDLDDFYLKHGYELWKRGK